MNTLAFLIRNLWRLYTFNLSTNVPIKISKICTTTEFPFWLLYGFLIHSSFILFYFLPLLRESFHYSWTAWLLSILKLTDFLRILYAALILSCLLFMVSGISQWNSLFMFIGDTRFFVFYMYSPTTMENNAALHCMASNWPSSFANIAF